MPLQLLEIRRTAWTLRAVDVEPAAHGEMVVDRLDAFLNGITVEKRHLHARKEIRNVVARRENRDGIVIDGFADRFQMHFALLQRNRTIRFDKPRRRIAAAADFMLQRPQDRVGIRQGNEQKVLFRFHRSCGFRDTQSM